MDKWEVRIQPLEKVNLKSIFEAITNLMVDLGMDATLGPWVKFAEQGSSSAPSASRDYLQILSPQSGT